MNRTTIRLLCIAFALGFAAPPLQAQELLRSGFLESYAKLEPADAPWISFIYTADDLRDVLGETRAVVVPQPEIFLAPNSKYKGISPDEMKVLADTMQAIVIEALADNYQIAQSPGHNTIVLRMALSNVHLKRKGRNLLGYTPIGFVATSVKRAMSDFSDKVLLTEVSWEAEILNGSNAEVLAQLVLQMGNNSNKKEFASWDDLVTAMSVGAMRLRCRLDNAVADAPRDCLEITEADLPQY